jgi:hypothetical protein
MAYHALKSSIWHLFCKFGKKSYSDSQQGASGYNQAGSRERRESGQLSHNSDRLPDQGWGKALTWQLMMEPETGTDVANQKTKAVKNTVFFDDVRIHESCLIGKEGDGWKVTGATFSDEHGGGRTRSHEDNHISRTRYRPVDSTTANGMMKAV